MKSCENLLKFSQTILRCENLCILHHVYSYASVLQTLFSRINLDSSKLAGRNLCHRILLELLSLYSTMWVENPTIYYKVVGVIHRYSYDTSDKVCKPAGTLLHMWEEIAVHIIRNGHLVVILQAVTFKTFCVRVLYWQYQVKFDPWGTGNLGIGRSHTPWYWGV